MRKNLKNIFGIRSLALILMFAAGAALQVSAQEMRETAAGSGAAVMDSTLIGKNIFNVLASGHGTGEIAVHQSQAIRKAMDAHIASNSSKTVSGYRVRIFNDNKQTSRSDSETALGRFRGMFPGIAAYRTYSNPFFRVTVGDFRTKSEAMQLLQQVKGSFPTAFIVRETIGYPAVDVEGSLVAVRTEPENE